MDSQDISMTENLMETSPRSAVFKGYIFKWTNYIKGYQKRFLVLKEGYMYYYGQESNGEANLKGSISIIGSKIVSLGPNQFQINTSDGQSFRFKTPGSEISGKWIMAFHQTCKYGEQPLEEKPQNESDPVVTHDTQKTLNCHKLCLEESLKILKGNIANLPKPEDQLSMDSASGCSIDSGPIKFSADESPRSPSESVSSPRSSLKISFSKIRNKKSIRTNISSKCSANNKVSPPEGLLKSRSFIDTPILSKKNSNFNLYEDENYALVYNNIQEFVINAENFVQNIQDLIDLEDSSFKIVSPTATSQTSPNQSSQPKVSEDRHLRSVTSDWPGMDKDEFFDANSELSHQDDRDCELAEELILANENHLNPHNNTSNESNENKMTTNIPKYRQQIPPKPASGLSLFSCIKNCVGKDLSKITLPVNFNEPLSMLQRAAEALEYSDLLDKAVSCDNPHLQICYLAAYVISSYSSTALRTSKPFNPLLNETFEFDRTADLGWRVLVEQVTHHPPSLASHVEGRGWVMNDSLTVESSLYFNSISIKPNSVTRIRFTSKDGCSYSWNRVTTTVKNIIVGKLWIEQSGVLTINNETNGGCCKVTFLEHKSSNASLYKRIEGVVLDSDSNLQYKLFGYYDSKLEFCKISTENGSSSPKESSNEILWSNKYNVKNLTPNCYYFTEFTCSLNQHDDFVAPTDSRRRPDQRALENGQLENATNFKSVLEDLQRQRRKNERSASRNSLTMDLHDSNNSLSTTADSIQNLNIQSPLCKSADLRKAIWFVFDEELSKKYNHAVFSYRGGYWEAKATNDWHLSPDIFNMNPKN